MVTRMPPPSRLREPFGQTVRRLRVEAGLAQEELALQAGIHRTYVSQLERGEKTASLAAIEALATVFGIRASELVRLAEDAGAPARRGKRRI